MKCSGKFKAVVIAILMIACTAQAQPNIGIGADVVSRYVWRGTGFGNDAAVQPYISFSAGMLEIGAWSSWGVNNAAANENDLYITLSGGNFALTVTDYHFPTGSSSDFFNYDSDDGVHILEAMGSFSNGPVSVMAAFNFLGDADNSFYGEIGYSAYSADDVNVDVVAGFGNSVYVLDESGDFNVVNLGVGVTKGSYTASYIVNPEAEISFLVFGVSL